MSRAIVPIGPFHPLLEEAEFFQLFVEGEKVVDVEVRLSYNHRGIERISENRTYHQIPFLVERVCGICSAVHPLAYIHAVEDIAEVKVPERAQIIRTLINELERIHSHLLWVGLAGHFIGYDTVWMWAWRYREPVMDALEMLSGNRVNYALAMIGGVIRDISEDTFQFVLKALDEIEGGTRLLTDAVMDDPVIHARLKGVGVLNHADAKAYAVTGPTARGSGLAIDVRHDDPYDYYDKIDWKVISLPEGDVFAKAAVRLLETFEAIKIVRQCLSRLRPGSLREDVKSIPPGEGCGHVEAPRGESFHYIRSDGSNRPVRHKIRAPSYVNVPSFKASCVGQTISDVAITIAAVDPCYSCTERMAVIRDGGQPIAGAELIELSRARTAQLKAELGSEGMEPMLAKRLRRLP